MNIVPKLIINDELLLRKPVKSDIETRFKYGRPAEFRKMVGGNMSHIPIFEYKDAFEFYQEILGREYEWIIEYKGSMIGTCRLTLAPDKDRGTYSIGIFDQNLYSKGLGTLITNTIVHYCFTVLKLKNIALVVLEFNERAIRCYEKCGFIKKIVLKNKAVIDGQLFNDVLMVQENNIC